VELARHVAKLKPYGVVVLAENVHTHADRLYCERAGCDLLQGTFFCQPELVYNRAMRPNSTAMLQIVAALHDPGVELSEVERLISTDVRLSYRLLHYINSAFFGLRSEIRSIGQALALLGLENLQRWATLTAFVSVDDKPPELTVTALTRARFCERAGLKVPGAIHSELFLLGLFSVIDALMDAPMKDVLGLIPIPEDMRDALISRRGHKGRLLECVTALELGDFERAEAVTRDAGRLYLEALVWANEASEALFG
jgi:EAL and modified HD-GYP domain-containing signal transduction protein